MIRTFKPLLQSKSCKSVCLYSGFPPTVLISSEVKKHFYPNYEMLLLFFFFQFMLYLGCINIIAWAARGRKVYMYLLQLNNDFIFASFGSWSFPCLIKMYCDNRYLLHHNRSDSLTSNLVFVLIYNIFILVIVKNSSPWNLSADCWSAVDQRLTAERLVNISITPCWTYAVFFPPV